MSIVLQDCFGKQYPFDTPIRIGSDSSNQIVLLDSSISPHHTEFNLQGNTVLIQDLDNAEGTFVNKKRIKGSKKVKPGDVISIGKIIFSIVETGPVELIPDPVPSIPPVVEEKPARPNRTGLIVALVLVFALIIIGLAGGYFVYQSSPNVQDYISSLTGGVVEESSASLNGEGPEILNLNDPALNTVFSTSFLQHIEDIQTGVDDNGAPLTISIIQDLMEQSTPDWSNYSHYVAQRNKTDEKNIEFSIVKGSVFSKAKSECKVFADENLNKHSPTNWPKTFLKTFVTGKAKKVESGITVNGVLADKYEITLENSTFADSIEEIVTGELYRAQSGGYLVQLSLVQKWSAGKWPGTKTVQFAGDQPVTVTHSAKFTYYPAGKLNVIVPAVCADKVKTALQINTN
jgi:hypothetical protein